MKIQRRFLSFIGIFDHRDTKPQFVRMKIGY